MQTKPGKKFSIDDLFHGQSHFVKRAKEMWFKQKTEGLKTFLEENYDFKIYKLRVFAWGYNNIHFFLKTNQGKLTARISQLKSHPRKLIFEDLCSGFIYLYGIPTKRVIRNKDGETYLLSPNGRTLQVTTYLDGKKRKRFRESHIVSSGELLAKLHRIGEQFPKEEISALELKSRQKPLEEFLSKTRGHLATYSRIPRKFADEAGLSELIEISKSTLDEIETAIKKYHKNIKETFIHGDYSPDNLVFDSEKATGVFDFEMAGFGSIYWDVSFAIVHWAFKLNNWKPKQIEEAFLKGYEKTAGPLNIELLVMIERLAVLERISATIYYFDNYVKKNYWILEFSYFFRKFRMF